MHTYAYICAQDIIKPFLLACEVKNTKLVSIALVSIQRMLANNAVCSEGVESIVGAMEQVWCVVLYIEGYSSAAGKVCFFFLQCVWGGCVGEEWYRCLCDAAVYKHHHGSKFSPGYVTHQVEHSHDEGVLLKLLQTTLTMFQSSQAITEEQVCCNDDCFLVTWSCCVVVSCCLCYAHCIQEPLVLV